jgi:hypothetical protein
MSLGALATIIEKGLLIWLAVMAAVVLMGCLNGKITITGMLAHDKDDQGDGKPAPERLQMLIGSLLAMATYAREALTKGVLDTPGLKNVSEHLASIGSIFPAAAAHAHHVPTLPDVSTQFIALFAASHGIYLGGKWGRHAWRGRGSSGHKPTKPTGPNIEPENEVPVTNYQFEPAGAEHEQQQALAQT